jgi:hypothetical protein
MTDADFAASETLAKHATGFDNHPARAAALLVGSAAALLLANYPPRLGIEVLEVLINDAKAGLRESMQ